MAALTPSSAVQESQNVLTPFANASRDGACGRKIWIDLDNSPHVPFFAPIIKELERRGYSVLLTARDCFQVTGLIDLLGLKCRIAGHHYGRNKILKVMGVCLRALQLAPLVIREKPMLALSHGSRAQFLLAAILRIPNLAIDDYEFSTRLGFIKPDWLMVPAVIPNESLGIPASRILKYEGIKEDVYIPLFRPDSSLRDSFGISPDSLMVTIRPPADEAHYHNPEADTLFEALLDFLSGIPKLKMVIVPRNQKQATAIRRLRPALMHGVIIILDHPVDGLNLIWNSDFVVSGGGTMNREAASLGVPVYSIFRGKIGAVDRYLSNQGRLVLLESKEDIRTKIVVSRRSRTARKSSASSSALTTVVRHVTAVAEMVSHRTTGWVADEGDRGLPCS